MSGRRATPELAQEYAENWGPLFQEPRVHTIQVPPRFLEDHLDRGLPAGLEVARTARLVTLQCNLAELEELDADAGHYSHPDSGLDGWEWAGLVSSARATHRRTKALLATIPREAPEPKAPVAPQPVVPQPEPTGECILVDRLPLGLVAADVARALRGRWPDVVVRARPAGATQEVRLYGVPGEDTRAAVDAVDALVVR